MCSPQRHVSTEYLEVAAQLLSPFKQRTYEKMGTALELRLLDVGCGPGIDAVALGRLVGERGLVVGIDHDGEMLAEARQRAKEAGLGDRVSFEQGDATILPFADARFDACRSERLFMHLEEPDQALNEMIRVVRPGGRIVAAETDWASLSCDSDLVDVERRLVRHRAENLLRNGYAARRLYRQFTRTDLSGVELEIFPLHSHDMTVYRFMTQSEETEQHALEAGLITAAELDAWRSELFERQENRQFFASINVIMVSAVKS